MTMQQAPDPRFEAGYGRFPEVIGRDWLGRWCHMSEADLVLVDRRRQPGTRLGFAVQPVPTGLTGRVVAGS